MSWIDQFLSGVKNVQADNVAVTQRETIDFLGTGVSVSDNATTGVTEITIDGGSTPTEVAFDSQITVASGNHYADWDGGATVCVLSLAATGNADGGVHEIRFAADTATGLVLPASMNPAGDLSVDGTTRQVTDWNAAVAHVLVLEQLGAITKAVLFEGAARQTGAPAVISAAADSGNPNALVVTYDRVMSAADRTGAFCAI